MRGVNKPKATGFQESLLANVFLMPRFSPSDLYIGHQRAIAFDGKRIDRMARRIIKGLFFKVKDHRVPDDHAIEILAVSRLSAMESALDPEIYLTIMQFISLVFEEPPQEFGKSFAFRWLQSPNGQDHTLWLLHFYDQLEFFCRTHALTSPKLDGPPDRRAG